LQWKQNEAAQAIEAKILFAEQKDWSGKRGFCEAKMRPTF
jgi:hypothetical protein